MPPNHTSVGPTELRTGPRGPSGLVLVAISEDGRTESRPLPASGTVVIGRHPECAVQFRDLRDISKRHAELEIGEGLRLRDLGSANGTVVRDRAVVGDEWVSIGLGEDFLVGATMMVVHGERAMAETPARKGIPTGAPQPGTMSALQQRLQRFARTDFTVLLTGETGVGKEYWARDLHRMSRRADRMFFAFNCAELGENMVESELFGHEKGAWTGAIERKIGFFEHASGGTLFLDEVGELPASTQAKLLRVLQERTIRRMGGLKDIPVDVRMVAATNRDLRTEVAERRFREDLLFRLAQLQLRIPPLRDRLDELEPLSRGILAESCEKLGRSALSLSPAAMTALRSHRWPGNIRELQNVLRSALVECDGDVIGPEHLEGIGGEHESAGRGSDGARGDFVLPPPPPGARNKPTRAELEVVLAHHRHNLTETAKYYGKDRRTIHNWLEEYGISGPQKKR